MTWVDPPVLGVTDLAQVVLTLGLEVEGGHVIQAQGQAPGGGDVLEQSPRQALAVAPLLGPGQAGLQGVAVGRGWPADLGQDSGSVGLAGGRLDQTRQNHLLKGPITPSGVPQPQTGADPVQDLPQQPGVLGGHHRVSADRI